MTAVAPARPERFDPEIPPPGFESKLVSFWRERRMITPRLQLVHTNAASGEGSVESSYSWAMRNTLPGFIHGTPKGSNYTTIPTCQIDRSGRGALMLPANRQSITNAKANSFSLGFETADTGTNDDPTISPFTDKQVESVAICCAYYAWGYGIPLEYPKAWDGSGTACHTEPFGYPDWTISDGKICPGQKKKAQVRDSILPRARQILAAWTEDDMPLSDEDVAKVADAVVAKLPPEQPLSKEDVDRVAAAVMAKLIATPSGARDLSTVMAWIKDDTIKIKKAVEAL